MQSRSPWVYLPVILVFCAVFASTEILDRSYPILFRQSDTWMRSMVDGRLIGIQGRGTREHQGTFLYDLDARTFRFVDKPLNDIIQGRSPHPIQFRRVPSGWIQPTQGTSPSTPADIQWAWKRYDENGEVCARGSFSITPTIDRSPSDQPTQIGDFAVGANNSGIYVIGFHGQLSVERHFPSPCQLSSIASIRFAAVGQDHFARLKEVSGRQMLELFRMLETGEVIPVSEWPVTAKPLIQGPTYTRSQPSFFGLDDRIYSLSESGESIEIHSMTGTPLGQVTFDGLDLKSATWNWHRGMIEVESTSGALACYLVDSGVAIALPPETKGKPFVLGTDRKHVLLGGLYDGLRNPHLFLVDRSSGEIVRTLSRRHSHTHHAFMDGEKLKVATLGFEYGLSVTVMDPVEGRILETHYPFRRWTAFMFLQVAVLIGVPLLWLRWSQHLGGSAVVDILLTGLFLIGIAAIRLYSGSHLGSLSRLPLQYLTGLMVSLACMSMLCNLTWNRSLWSRWLPCGLVHAFAIWLYTAILFTGPEWHYNEKANGVRVAVGTSSSVMPYWEVTAVAIFFVLFAFAMVLVRFVGIRLTREGSQVHDSRKSSLWQIAMSDLLIVFLLVALLISPIQIAWRAGLYYHDWWPWIVNYLIAIGIALLAMYLGLHQKRRVVNFGSVLSIVLIVLLFADFSTDFVWAWNRPMTVFGSLVRSFIVGAVATFVFASRVRDAGYILKRQEMSDAATVGMAPHVSSM